MMEARCPCHQLVDAITRDACNIESATLDQTHHTHTDSDLGVIVIRGQLRLRDRLVVRIRAALAFAGGRHAAGQLLSAPALLAVL